MGIIFVHPKRFEMKAAILVTAIVIFTFAEATNVNKKGGRASRSIDAPRCSKVEYKYMYGSIIDTVGTFASANACAKVCDGRVACRFWTIYLPVSPDHNAPGVIGECVLLGEFPKPQLTKVDGWISGVTGCKKPH